MKTLQINGQNTGLLNGDLVKISYLSGGKFSISFYRSDTIINVPCPDDKMDVGITYEAYGDWSLKYSDIRVEIINLIVCTYGLKCQEIDSMSNEEAWLYQLVNAF